MNAEIPDDVVRNLKKVMGMTSTFRKKLEDCVIKKMFHFKNSPETNEILQCDSLISEDSSPVKDQFMEKVSSLSGICNRALEKDTIQIKEDKVYETFYDSSSKYCDGFFNSKYCDGNEGKIHKQGQQDIKQGHSEKVQTIFSQQFKNFANSSANVNRFVATDIAVVSEDFEIGKTSDEDSVIDRILIENLNRVDIANNSADSFGTELEEEQPEKLILVEIYRRISSFFEIGIVTPVSMIIENHFEIFKFGLAIIVCTIYMYFTNAKKELRKKLSSKMKNFSAKSQSKFSTVKSRQPVKTSDSMEPLIILKSNDNSKEELDMPCETEHDKNVSENNIVNQTLTDRNKPEYENGPSNNCELQSYEENRLKFKNFDEFDSLLLAKCKMYPNYFYTEMERLARDKIASEGVDEYDEKFEEKVETGRYFTEISGLDLTNELVKESRLKETVTLQSPSKESFSWKYVNTQLKEIELIEFGNQSELFALLSPIDEDEENAAKTEKFCNISDISQSSDSFSTEPRLLDIDEKLFQQETKTNARNVGTKLEFEEQHPIFTDNLEHELFSENSETKYESINITQFLNNNLATKTVYESGQLSSNSPRNCLEDLSDLSLCDHPAENNLETIRDGNTKALEFESCFNESEDKNEANTFCKRLIGDSSVCADQDFNKVISLLHETSSELSFDTSDLNNTAYSTKEDKILIKSTEVPIFLNESEIIACTPSNFEVGNNNFEKILPKNYALDRIKITYESNNSPHHSSKDDYSKCNELPVGNYVECTAIEELSNKSLTGEKAIDFSEHDLIEEYKTSVTTGIHIVEYVSDKVEDLNLTQIKSKKEAKLNETAKLKNGEEIKNSYPICNTEHLENENCNRINNQNKMHQTLQYSQEFNDTLKVPLEMNSHQCLKYMKSLEENIEQHSYDVFRKWRSFDLIPFKQEKSVDLYKVFSSSMPDVRNIDVDPEGSAQELSQPSCSYQLGPSIAEKGINRCLQNLPRIRLPISIKNSKEDTNGDYQCLPSYASELFEMEAQSSSSTYVVAKFTTEVKADHMEQGDFQCSPSYALGPSEMEAPSSSSNYAVVNFASEEKTDRKKHEGSLCLSSHVSGPFEMEYELSGYNNSVTDFASEVKTDREKQDFQSLPYYASESFDITDSLDTSNNAAANSASKVKTDSKKHKKQKSFGSKVSSMFNGVRRLQGRVITAAREIGDYKKKKNSVD